MLLAYKFVYMHTVRLLFAGAKTNDNDAYMDNIFAAHSCVR